MICPHCKKELKEGEVIALFSAWRGSKTSQKKRKSSAENGKKGGRPRVALKKD
jgi:hypothetical protein